MRMEDRPSFLHWEGGGMRGRGAQGRLGREVGGAGHGAQRSAGAVADNAASRCMSSALDGGGHGVDDGRAAGGGRVLIDNVNAVPALHGMGRSTAGAAGAACRQHVGSGANAEAIPGRQRARRQAAAQTDAEPARRRRKPKARPHVAPLGDAAGLLSNHVDDAVAPGAHNIAHVDLRQCEGWVKEGGRAGGGREGGRAGGV